MKIKYINNMNIMPGKIKNNGVPQKLALFV